MTFLRAAQEYSNKNKHDPIWGGTKQLTLHALRI